MTKYKTYILNDFYGEDFELIPVSYKYAVNNSLAIELYDAEDTSPFATLTVNLYESNYQPDGDYAYLDTNNCPWAQRFIEENELGENTGIMGFSGYASYPLYKFDLTKMNKGD